MPRSRRPDHAPHAARDEALCPSPPLRGLVVGLGSIGRRHAANLRALGVEPVIGCDVDRRRRRAAEHDLGITTLDRPEQAWDRAPDLAVIAVPPHRHIELALEAAEHGCHLLIEKPLSHCLDGVEALARVCEARQRRALVACNMRFHPGPSTVRDWLKAGRVGRPIFGRWQCGSYLPRWSAGDAYRASYSADPRWGGALLDCIHELDLALWTLGPARLAGSACQPAETLGVDTDGLAELLLQHDDGAISNVHVNFVQRDYRRCCQVAGTNGTIYWDWESTRVVRYDGEGRLAEQAPLPPGWEMNDMYLDELRHFLRCIRDAHPPCNPLDEAARALTLALAARECGRARGGFTRRSALRTIRDVGDPVIA
jgi:predicted dehydrogenase